MDIFANLFAGLGLFFIGIRLIGNNLKQLAGRRMRQLISKAVAGRGSVALFGLAAGAIMQSTNAVTYVLVAMVTAGAIDKRRALPVINWANIGISILVVLASINLHVLALLLAGLAGLSYYLNLDQSARYRHGVGALMGIGLLFLGIDFIKHASAILKAAPWLKDSLAATAAYPLVGFAIGAMAALVVQSSMTVAVVAMAMTSAGLLDFSSGSMVVLGAGLGSALSALSLAGKLKGSARQLVHYQVVLRLLGVSILLCLWLVDGLVGAHWVETALVRAGLAAPAQLAAVFVMMQVAANVGMRLLLPLVLAALERRSPPSAEETLERPVYLQDEALVEPESALLLVDLEQHRLLGSLPVYLAPMQAEHTAPSSGPSVATRCSAEQSVVRQCDLFLAELLDRHNSRRVLERSMVLRDRNELLGSLQESLLELSRMAADATLADEIRALVSPQIESLHMMLATLAEAGRQPEADDLDLLRQLTHDRSEMMDALRRRMQGEAHAAPVQQAVFAATTLFERCVWLLRRYVLLLDPAKA